MEDDKGLAERAETIGKKYKDMMAAPMEWPPKDMTLKIFEAHGFKCAIRKNPRMGNINGYVLLPKDHPDAKNGYDEIDVRVHGGLTFAQRDTEGGLWVGFDTAHAGDFIPGMPLGFNNPETEIHWTIEMVIEETEHLAEQLRAKAQSG